MLFYFFCYDLGLCDTLPQTFCDIRRNRETFLENVIPKRVDWKLVGFPDLDIFITIFKGQTTDNVSSSSALETVPL